MRYTGHLDVHHTLERTLRRAGLPLAYSQGYNRRPRLSLAAPLPLGVTSSGELAEVWLTEPRSEDQLLQDLRAAAPPGLGLIAVQTVAEGTPKLPNLVLAAEYEVQLRQPPADLEARVAGLLAAEGLTRTRGKKTYDLRPLVETLAVARIDSVVSLKMRLKAQEGATGRADEVLLALDLPLETARICRTRLILQV